MIKYVALCLGLISSPALACESVYLHLGSYHTSDVFTDPNEVNLGLGCEFNHLEVGFYNNTYNDLSLYAVLSTDSYYGLSLFGGVATGYEDDDFASDEGVMPMAGIQYQYSVHSFRVAPTVGGVVISYSVKVY